MKRIVVSSVILAVSALFGCTESIPPPVCRVADAIQQNEPKQLMCLLIMENKVALLEDKSSRFYAPGVAHSQAICNLHQEVWLTTGLNVDIQAKLYEGSQQSIFLCAIDNPIAMDNNRLTLPDFREKPEAAYLRIVDLYGLNKTDMQQPQSLVPLREAFVTRIQNNTNPHK